jgi:hypothetical protein
VKMVRVLSLAIRVGEELRVGEATCNRESSMGVSTRRGTCDWLWNTTCPYVGIHGLDMGWSDQFKFNK